MKNNIEFSFTKELESSDNTRIKSIAYIMNFLNGRYKFEEICNLVFEKWEYLYNVPENIFYKHDKKVSFEELRDHIFLNQQISNHLDVTGDTIEIIRYVLDLLNAKGLNL
jgi:hypothetical protein